MKPNSIEPRRISLFQRIKNKIRYGLVFQVLRNKLSKLGFEFIPYYWVQEGTSDICLPSVQGDTYGLSVVFLKEDDMKTLGENSRGYLEEELIGWLTKGKKCLGLKQFDDIIAFMWIDFNECSFKPNKIPLKNNECYLSDMYTMEAFRGRNLATYLRYQSYDILRNMGRDTIYSVSEYFNKSAIKYKQKLNAKNIRLVLFIRLFRKVKICYTIRSF